MDRSSYGRKVTKHTVEMRSNYAKERVHRMEREYQQMLAGNEMDRSVSRPPAGGGGDGLYNQRHTDSKKLERNPTMAAAAAALPSRLLPRTAGVVSLEAAYSNYSTYVHIW